MRFIIKIRDLSMVQVKKDHQETTFEHWRKTSRVSIHATLQKFGDRAYSVSFRLNWMPYLNRDKDALIESGQGRMPYFNLDKDALINQIYGLIVPVLLNDVMTWRLSDVWEMYLHKLLARQKPRQ